jgi:cellulose synthase/poly-beta-1,6-N-acetylglucosamine synthase-like glycosyltransferase
MNRDRLVPGGTSFVRRALIVAVVLAAAAAAVWMAIEYSLFLYLVYVAVSLLIGAVATSTLIWMLYAWRTPDSLADSRLEADGRKPKHSFSLIVPARHEEAVLETTLSRLISSHYPDYEVLVVVGSDDPGTREVAERMADRHPERIRVIVDPSWPKSKPKALNAALPYCRGTITGVFDAEDDVHPALLRRVDQCFQTTDADIVQAGVQLMNFRSHWFTVHNVLEYYFWFRSRLHVHARQRFIPLGGNTVFIRTPIVRTVGGWADCLAEDCEIGVRLSALGARTAVFYEPDLVTREECPATVGDFVRQRTRWNQGFLQTLARGYWRRLPARQSLLGAYILASPYFMALAWLLIPAAIATAVAIKAPIVITLVSFLPLLPMLAMLVVQCAGLAEFCRLYGTGRPSVRDYARLILGLLVYQALLAFAAARAVVREARGFRGWEKTAHLGLHLGRHATADTGSAMAVSNRPQPAEVQQAAPVPERRPGMPPLAESLVSSHAMVEVQADALISRAMGRPAEELGLHASPMSGRTALGRQAGNGHAVVDSHTLDGMFGDLSAAPLWARLNWARPPGSDDTLVIPRSGSGDEATGHRPDRVRRLLRGLATRRVELAFLSILLVIAVVVSATNMLHWPAAQFDEGTYVSYAWALQHGRLANYTYSYGHPPVGWMLIFFWDEAGGVLGHAGFSVDRGRVLMLLVALVSCALLYFLARRLGFSRVSAGAALILFALSPLGVFFHRAVLLDNPSTAFAIAAFLLAWTPNRRLWAYAGSGACFALSVLSKETSFALLPALVVAVVQNTDRRTRRYCLMLFLASFVLAGGFYPLYATLKGELLPGHGHVSLSGYLIVQLFTRQGTGSIFNPHSQAHAIVAQWLQLDRWLLGAALVLSPVALARRTTRAVALAFLIQVLTVFRPGYLPNMYVIGMLPFAALIVPGSIEALWRWARSLHIPVASWGLRAAAAAAACALVLAAAPHWVSGDRTAMTVQLDGPDRAAQQWVLQHVPRNKRVIVDDEYWLFLVEHGYNDRPMQGGFFSATVVSYWPLDYDPAVKRTFPRGWREFNYIVLTQAILDTVTNTPTAAAAIEHSQVVASFGHGTSTIQIRKIVGTGR